MLPVRCNWLFLRRHFSNLKKQTMTITLNREKTVCTVDGIEIKLNQSIDYQSANTNEKPSMGKVLEFKYAGYQQSDTSSVWMNLKDLQEDKETEWISVYNWAQKNLPAKNESTEPETTVDLPF